MPASARPAGFHPFARKRRKDALAKRCETGYFRFGGHSTTTQEWCNNSAQMTYEHWCVITATIHSCDWENPPSQAPSTLFVGHFIVAFSYVVDGNNYGGEFYSSHAWEKGTDLAILYNPQNPGESSACDDDESQSEAALEWIFGVLERFDVV